MPAPELATTPTAPPGTGSGLADDAVVTDDAVDVGDAVGTAAGTGRPVAGRGLVGEAGDALTLLRLPGQARLAAEPGLVGHVRSRLVAALGPGRRGPTTPDRGAPTARGPLPPSPATPGPDRVVLTRSVVNRALACPLHGTVPGTGTGSDASAGPDLALARAALVRALFRQLLTVGSIGDPLADGLEALESDPSEAPLARCVQVLPRARRDALARDVAGHARQLTAHWCRPAPAWLPRTAVRLHAALGTSGFELAGHVDLAVGEPSPDRASVALVSLRTGDRSPVHELDRHLAALAYTLSQGVPPFSVATFYSATGTLAVDAVDLAMLERAADRVAAAARRIAGGHQDDRVAAGSEDARCPWCGDLPASGSTLADAVAGAGGGLAGGVTGLRHGPGGYPATARQTGQVSQPTGRVAGQHGAGRPGAGGPVPPTSPYGSCRRHRRR